MAKSGGGCFPVTLALLTSLAIAACVTRKAVAPLPPPKPTPGVVIQIDCADPPPQFIRLCIELLQMAYPPASDMPPL